MGDEMLPRPRKEAAGSRHEPGIVRQTAPAIADKIGPQTESMMEAVLHRENLLTALRRVRSNKGAPGVDGVTIDDLPELLRREWPAIRDQLLSGTYTPSPVRRVDIPKPGKGKGMRMLGIPTVVDRLIQQAILQVLTPIFDPDFSDHSFGFRPGRSAHQAVEQARGFMAEGRRWVVDLDLEKFFDRVNHDILMSRVARKVRDKRLLKLIRRYLTAGIMTEGVVCPRLAGTPQGGPLSPLLSNVLLDDLDRELERREHSFCRYADDCNVYVRSKEAGERVMASLTLFLESRLRLKVNAAKSAVDRPWNRKFLGYTVTTNRAPRLKPARASVRRATDRIREITQRGRGRNIERVIAEVNRFTQGWVGYYRLADVAQDFKTLDQWLRRRLRKILWEQWKTPRNRYRKLVQLGVNAARAKKATATGRGAWWNAGASHMHAGVTNAQLAKWGLRTLLSTLRTLQRST